MSKLPPRTDSVSPGDLVLSYRSMDGGYRGLGVDTLAEYVAQLVPDALGIAAGGLVGQVLVKNGVADYDTGWTDLPAAGVTTVNGRNGAVTLDKTDVGLGSVPNIDATQPGNIGQDSTHRWATDAEKGYWNAKQETLVSGTTIKTVNGNSLLGAGDLVIAGGGGIPEAPVDGQQYARKNAAWAVVTGGGGGTAPRRVTASATFLDEDTSQLVSITDAAVTANTVFSVEIRSEDYAIQKVSASVLSLTPGVGYSVLVVAPDGATGLVDLIISIQEAA